MVHQSATVAVPISDYQTKCAGLQAPSGVFTIFALIPLPGAKRPPSGCKEGTSIYFPFSTTLPDTVPLAST